jgi:hypothetical protein
MASNEYMDADFVDQIGGADLALGLIRRVKSLLDRGMRWNPEILALTREGVECDPLAEEAYSFSLLGAAIRARWMMRDEIAAAEVSHTHIRQVIEAIEAVRHESIGPGSKWLFDEVVLDGLEKAVREYRTELIGLAHRFVA